MMVTSKPIHSVGAKPHYHSRLGIVIAKELGDLIRWPRSAVFLALALLVVPLALAQTGGVDEAHFDMRLWPVLEDSNVRTILPSGMGMISLFLPMITGILMGLSEAIATLEPLLITSARRWDIVAGKLLAFGMAWCLFSAVQVLMLAVIPHIPFVMALYPFLTYFHPDAAFFVKLALVFAFGGWSGYAVLNYLHTRPAGLTFGIPIVTFGIVGFASYHWSGLWPLIGFIPMVNVQDGLSAVFSELPYDRRVENPSQHFGAAWDHPHFWLICIIGSVITTFVMAALTVRSLNAGAQLSNTAK